MFKSQCQWTGYDWVLETTSGIAQTWIKSFLKQIIKATVLKWQSKMNFKVCSFSQTLRRLNLINISYRFAYWWSNVHGLESQWKIVFTYKVTTFDAGRSTIDFKTLFLNDPVWPGNLVYPLEDEGFSIFWYLHVAYDCWWATSRLDVFDLNKIFLKNRINNIRHCLFCALGNQSQTPFPLKDLGIVC